MSQVNPNLETILSQLESNRQQAHTDSVSVQTLINLAMIELGQIRAGVNQSAAYLGDIRADMEGVHLKLDDIIAQNAQIIPLLTNLRDTADIMNNNAALNWANLLNFLELMNTNAAANALYIRAAICGDCSVIQPPIDQGFQCNTATGGYTGSANPWESSFVWYVSPSLTGQIGDKVRLRVNSVTEPMDLIYLRETPSGSSITHSLTPGGDYIEFTLSAATSVLGFSRQNANPFNFNFTTCVQHLE